MIPINKKKAYDRIQNQFMTLKKNLRKIGIKKNILNLKKSIYQKKKKNLQLKLHLMMKKITALPLRLGKRQLLFNIVLEVLANAVEQKKK